MIIWRLYNGCIGQYGAIFGKQLLGYPWKGTQIFRWNSIPTSNTCVVGSEGIRNYDYAVSKQNEHKQQASTEQ